MHSAVAPGVICITEEKQSRVNPIREGRASDERTLLYYQRVLKLRQSAISAWNQGARARRTAAATGGYICFEFSLIYGRIICM